MNNSVYIQNRPINFYVVDDDKIILSKLKKLIEGMNNKISLFSHPYEFISAVTKHTPSSFMSIKESKNEIINKAMLQTNIYRHDFPVDIIICDYDMPSLNGLEVISEIDSNNSRYIVMLTSVATYQEAVNSLNDGLIDYFLVKTELNQDHLYNLVKNYKKKLFNKIEYLDPSLQIREDKVYYILDSDLSTYYPGENKIVYNQKIKDTSNLANIFKDNGLSIKSNLIPIIFNDEGDILKCLLYPYQKISKEYNQAIIKNEAEVQEILRALSNG